MWEIVLAALNYLSASCISCLGPWCQVPMPMMGIFCPVWRRRFNSSQDIFRICFFEREKEVCAGGESTEDCKSSRNFLFGVLRSKFKKVPREESGLDLFLLHDDVFFFELVFGKRCAPHNMRVRSLVFFRPVPCFSPSSFSGNLADCVKRKKM